MSRFRLEILLCNFITYFNTEILQHMTTDEKIDLLKEEIGFTDEEIEELDIVKRCLE